MTRKIAAALVAAAALGLSACASPDGLGGTRAVDTSTTPTHTTTKAFSARTVEPAAEKGSPKVTSLDEIAERAFLSTVADYQSPSDEASLMVGRATCTLLDGGSTPDTLAYELMVADGPVVPGFLNDELPFFYGAAMGSLCAEYGEQFFG